MTAAADNYAEVLYELSVSEDSIQDTKKIFQDSPELKASLSNPTVPYKTKCRIIDRVIPEEMRNFVKVVLKHQKTEKLDSIFADYEALCKKKANVVHAVLRYVAAPSEEQLTGIKARLCRELHAQDAEIELKEDPDLIGGFVLSAGDVEYDWSLKGRFRKLEQQLTTRR